MLTINLLPSEEKKFVKLEETRRIILFFMGGLVIMFVIGSVFLSPSFLPLYLERKELERSLRLEEEARAALKVDEVFGRIRRFESAISSVRNFARVSPRASEILEELLAYAGSSILLDNVTVKKGGETILTGRAVARRDLLQFEKNLRDSGKFQEISSPLSNIVRETNINFTLQGKLKPAYGL